MAGKQGCAGVSELRNLSTKTSTLGAYARENIFKCIFKEFFCIKGIYLWFSHTNSSSYLMKVSVLIYENQYQFRPMFLRDGL